MLVTSTARHTQEELPRGLGGGQPHHGPVVTQSRGQVLADQSVSRILIVLSFQVIPRNILFFLSQHRSEHLIARVPHKPVLMLYTGKEDIQNTGVNLTSSRGSEASEHLGKTVEA